MTDQLDEFVAALHAYADEEYCRGVRTIQTAPCLGWEAKVKSGRFGQDEKAAHEKANRHFGAHFGIYAAVERALLQVRRRSTD